ncbi:hypothetical protein C5S32_00700 [ANME-1 cluster archaeon GoMg1]|nr:hypothetical protein [ANME-1 cluster archaeon GoMg1]
MNQANRLAEILRIIEEVENSSLSVSRYFKEKDAPFGYVQYYTYKKALRERGVEGLYNQRR